MMTTEFVSYDDYKSVWLNDITDGNPSSIEKGQRFAQKLIMEWTDYTDASDDDMFFCDGSGDGGIDVAYLQRGDDSEESTNEGDVWFLIQSKYGTAFQGKDTLLQEAQKIIDTIDGKNKTLSSLSADIVEKLQNFRQKQGEKDCLVLVFATVDPLNETERRVLDDIKAIGKQRFGSLFDVDSVSIKTIYDRCQESLPQKYFLPFVANLVPSGSDLLVGSIKLISLFEFLKAYKNETGDLDLLYEKNVRRFLGANKKVNKGIAGTLRDNPERFGLFNNGITIVVEDFKMLETDKYELTEPYVVNGCQTTKTIWEILDKKINSGGTNSKNAEEFLDWQEKLKKGIVVVKVVKVGAGTSAESMLADTTRYTNSQNAVQAKDFIALEVSFKNWANQIANKYDLFLEIQRGGWESQKAKQKQPQYGGQQFTFWVNAFELMKVYGAAWLSEPGLAFRTTPPFVPGGKIFKQITEENNFSIDDLYAAFCLYKTAERTSNIRPAKNPKRSRYLYYYVVVELLRRIICSATGLEPTPSDVTQYIIKLFDVTKPQSEAARLLLETATLLDDDYFSKNGANSAFEEEAFNATGDLNNFLGHFDVKKAAKLQALILFNWNDLRRKSGDSQSRLDIIVAEML